MSGRSLTDTKKEAHEEETLNQAILLSSTKKKITRDILASMSGETINRVKNDRPDIVRTFCARQGIDKCDGLIGIEHFLVEQVVEIKGGKRTSFIKKNKSQLEKVLENREQIIADQDQLQKAKEKILHTAFDIGAQTNKTGIPELMESFCLVFENHLSKIDEYRGNLNSISDGKPIKMAFLIEISCHADDVYLNNGRTVVRRYNDIYPLFNWMVEELEKADPKLLDFVILYFRSPVNKDIEDILAIDMKNVRGCLRKQQVIVYEYCEDPIHVDFLKEEIPGKGFRYYPIVKNADTFGKDVLPSLIKAIEYKINNTPYVAPRIVQGMVYAYGKEQIKKMTKGSLLPYKYNTAEIRERYDQFVEKYPIPGSQDDSDTE